MKLRFHRLQKTVSFKNWFLGFKAFFRTYEELSQSVESELKKTFRFSEVKFFGSGREALRHAINSVAKPGGEIILPAYGCSILSKVVIHEGLTPIFVDTAENSVHMDVEGVIANISDNTVAIVIVHEFGIPFPESLLRRIRSRFRGLIVEDAAIAMASRFESGARVGTVGDCVILSGSLGKPHSCYRWGALCSSSAQFDYPCYKKRNSSFISAVYILFYIILQNVFIYQSVKKLIRKKASEDAENPAVFFTLPSRFDAFVMRGQIREMDEINDRRKRVCERLIPDSGSKGKWRMFHGATSTFSRVPFYFSDGVSQRLTQFDAVGIESYVPHSNVKKTKFKNAIGLSEHLLVLVLSEKPDFPSKAREVLNES